MIKQNYLISLWLVFLLISCDINTNNDSDIVGIRNIKYSELAVDTVIIDSINTSFLGFSGISGNEIYFVDEMFCVYSAFAPDGKLKYQKLGQGNGPEEVPIKGISAASMFSDSTLLLLGSSCDNYIFNNFKNKIRVAVQYQGPRSSYDDYGIYTYMYDHLIVQKYGNKLYYNVYSETDDFDFINSPKDYFDKAHIIMQANAITGNVEKMQGGYSSLYKTDPSKYNAYPFLAYDLDSKGDFYICYEADSLIQIYDNDFNKLRRHGFQGRDMQTDYPKLTTFETFYEFYITKRNEYGYYNSIKYIEPLDMVIRTYKKGGDATTDGLQIYQANDLIADIDVPIGFKDRKSVV